MSGLHSFRFLFFTQFVLMIIMGDKVNITFYSCDTLLGIDFLLGIEVFSASSYKRIMIFMSSGSCN